ncbi:Udp-3-o-[3-hydroxymyristoyl] n-acetylglucosamine deacetylase [Globisporangium polare]
MVTAVRGHRWQRTLSRSFELAGVGLHSGAPVRVRVHPADANTGVVFRTQHQQRHEVHAHISHVDDRKSQLCTQLTTPDGLANISTVEHLMAALTAARVSNAYVDVDAVGTATSSTNDQKKCVAELPILDGSSLPFLDAIEDAGVEEQSRGSSNASLRCIRVKRPVQVLLDDKAAWLLPMPAQLGGGVRMPTLNMSVQVNFEHKGLGTKFCRFILGDDPEVNMQAFRNEVAPARTFTFEEEIAWMRAHGLALGGSLDNAVVFREVALSAPVPVSSPSCAQLSSLADRVLNPQGLRFAEDEWARHKLLDCIGDIGLAGMPLHGYFFATSPGHALTHKLLRELFTDEANYEEVRL